MRFIYIKEKKIHGLILREGERVWDVEIRFGISFNFWEARAWEFLAMEATDWLERENWNREIAGEKLEKRDGLVLGATAGSGGSGLESTMVDDLWVWERGWSMGLEREVA